VSQLWICDSVGIPVVPSSDPTTAPNSPLLKLSCEPGGSSRSIRLGALSAFWLRSALCCRPVERGAVRVERRPVNRLVAATAGPCRVSAAVSETGLMTQGRPSGESVLGAQPAGPPGHRDPDRIAPHQGARLGGRRRGTPAQWPTVATYNSHWRRYQRRTRREIPLLILAPRSARL
jgi:hypothetical protein